MEYLIKVNATNWKANYVGAGQITSWKDRAKRYSTKRGAKIGLARLRRYKPFPDAVIEPLKEHNQ